MRTAIGILPFMVFFVGCMAFPALPEPEDESGGLAAPVELRVCVLRDKDVAIERAERMIAAVGEALTAFGIAVTTPWMREWQRASFDHQGLIRDIATRPLEVPCDRLLALVGRDARDFLWGLLLPEILGAVETRTYTKGYAVAETGSLNQIMSFTSPEKIVLHEVWHLIGVQHADSPAEARDRILALKQMATRNRRHGCDFFPTITPQGQILRSRLEVDRRFKIANRKQQNPPGQLRSHQQSCRGPIPAIDAEGLPSKPNLISER